MSRRTETAYKAWSPGKPAQHVEAQDSGFSRKGPWHLSRTMASQSGMTNKWLSDQGLISVKEQWVKIHYPATDR